MNNSEVKADRSFEACNLSSVEKQPVSSRIHFKNTEELYNALKKLKDEDPGDGGT